VFVCEEEEEFLTSSEGCQGKGQNLRKKVRSTTLDIYFRLQFFVTSRLTLTDRSEICHWRDFHTQQKNADVPSLYIRGVLSVRYTDGQRMNSVTLIHRRSLDSFDFLEPGGVELNL